MIPIRNKKKTLKVTVEEMRNFAFTYVEKYAPSKQQLKTYLLKKYLKSSVPNVKKKDVSDLIDIVLTDLEKNRFINDKFYSDSKAKSMIQRGSSINKIRSYLIGKGINSEFIKDTVNKIQDENSDQDFFSAIKICKKKELDLQEKKIIEFYFIKRICLYLHKMDSILRLQKKSWTLKKMILTKL